MTELLSDERLRVFAYRNRPTLADPLPMPKADEVHAMARELLALRARVIELDVAASNAIGEMLALRSAGPVIPEMPSKETMHRVRKVVWGAICQEQPASDAAVEIWTAIRDALIAEMQK